MLNLLGDAIIKYFGRLLISFDNSLIDAVYILFIL